MAVVPAPATPTHELGGARFTSLATPSRGSSDTSVWLVEITPGTAGAPHRLTREEVFVVLAGRAEVRLGEEVSIAVAGDAIVVPAGGPVRPRAGGSRSRCVPSAACRWAGRLNWRTASRSRRRGRGERARRPAGPPVRDGLPVARRGPARAARRPRLERGAAGVRIVLLALRAGPVSLRDLPGVLGTSKQAVSKLVDAMVTAGYVERAADPGDARAKRVQLSDRGHALLAEVETIWAELEQAWARTLGDTRLEALRGDLETVLREASGGSLPAVRTVGD